MLLNEDAGTAFDLLDCSQADNGPLAAGVVQHCLNSCRATLQYPVTPGQDTLVAAAHATPL